MSALARLSILAVLLANPPGAPLGSTKFAPTPDRPLGWRGDGTGRYPGATPPTQWERKRSGGSYTARGILWATPMPNARPSGV